MTYKNIRPYGRPIKDYPGLQPQDIPMQKFAEGRLNQGMNTIIDPADIPTGSLRLALNAITRYDKEQRRPGNVQFAVDGTIVPTPIAPLIGNPPSPISTSILALRTFALQDTSTFTLLFTAAYVYQLIGGVWTPMKFNNIPLANPPPPTAVFPFVPLLGADTDRFSTALIFNTFVFANNGVNPVSSIDLVNNRYAVLAAPQIVKTSTNFRYITGFDNRLVGAAIAGENEVYIGWGGNGPVDTVSQPGLSLGWTQFDDSIDISAGNSPLEDSPSDLSDPITGLFGFTNVMLVLREKSIWMATKQPIATDPFSFFCFVPNVGCNCPRSAQIIDDGIAFLDQRKNTVYYFVPGASIQPIGRPIENSIFQGLNDLNDIFSSYDPTSGDYTICIPQAGSSTVRTYTYNFKSQAWTTSEYNNITCAEDLNLNSGQLEIGELVGQIGDLQGTIGELTRVTDAFYTRAYGKGDGTVVVDDPLANADDMTTNSSNDGNSFTTTFVSKDFKNDVIDSYFAKISIEFIETLGGSGTLYYNKHTGADDLTSPNWKVAKKFTTTTLNEPDLITWVNQIKSRRLAWRLDITAGSFAILGYEIHWYPSGLQKPAGLG
jgi:hypothetical protein